MINKVKDVVRTQTVKDTSILFLGSILSSVFAIIFTILFGRYLGPEILAIGTAIVSFIAICNSIGDLGLGSSLFRYASKYWATGEKAKAEGVLENVFKVRLITALIFFIVLSVLSPFLTPRLFKLDDAFLVIFSAVAVAGTLLFDFQVQTFQSQKRFRNAAILLTLNNGLRLILLITLYSAGYLTLLSTIVIFALSPLLIFLSSLKWHAIRFSFKEKIQGVREFGKFSGWMGANRVLGAVAGRVDTILLLQYLSTYESGIFAAAKQLSFGIPIVAGSFATVLAPRFSSMEGTKLKTYFRKTMLLSLLISSGLFVGYLVAPFVIKLFGSEFAASAQVLQWLILGYIPFIVSIPTVNLLIYALGKPHIVVWISLVNIFIVFGSISYFSGSLGVMAPVVASALTNLNLLLVSGIYSLVLLRQR